MPTPNRVARPYPQARRSDQLDSYHGTPVPDPYRWLEDPDSDETRAWVAAQNVVSGEYLAALPLQGAFRTRMTELWDYPKTGVPWQVAGRYFQFRNSGLQNQNVLYTAPSLDGAWRVLLDPNTLSENGTVALGGLSVSPDGQQLAYALSGGGSDWLEWHVRDVQSGEDHTDVLEHSKFSGAAWDPGSRGFWYSRYPAPGEGEALTGANTRQELYYHQLGTPQSQDLLELSRPDQPEWGFGAEVTIDGQYLVVNVWQGTSPKNQLWVRRLDGRAPGSPVGNLGEWQELAGDFSAMLNFVGNDGALFYLHTDLAETGEAPLGRIIGHNLSTGQRREVVPEGQDKLEQAALVPGGLLALTLHDASHRLTLYGRDGGQGRDVPLPALGTVAGLSARADQREVFLGFTNFLTPSVPYRLDLETLELKALTPSPINFDPGDYSVEQQFASSQDGTRVPLFVVRRRGLPAGPRPTLLYGYGGFGISLTPGFSPARLAWLERGGVLAVANLRGGGEYGEEWRRAGTLERKQNVFDDFYACAEHLIQSGQTTPAQLGIQGGSNGGLLVGAALTQRPELFGAAVPQVGVMDMLRFQHFTVGWAWVSDYGSSEDPAMFPVLHGYSPLHNLTPRAYPATLITTGDHDDRVVPAHSYKFAAQMQYTQMQPAQTGEAPVLIRVQTEAGHGAGMPTQLVIQEAADIWSFLAHHLGLEDQAAPA